MSDPIVLGDPLLTVKRVAQLYELTEATVCRRCARGTMVPPPVLSRPYRFSATAQWA